MAHEKEEVLKKAHQVQQEKNDKISQLKKQMAILKEILISKEDSRIDTLETLAGKVKSMNFANNEVYIHYVIVVNFHINCFHNTMAIFSTCSVSCQRINFRSKVAIPHVWMNKK